MNLYLAFSEELIEKHIKVCYNKTRKAVEI